jgi:hypothetical protein
MKQGNQQKSKTYTKPYQILDIAIPCIGLFPVWFLFVATWQARTTASPMLIFINTALVTTVIAFVAVDYIVALLINPAYQTGAEGRKKKIVQRLIWNLAIVAVAILCATVIPNI